MAKNKIRIGIIGAGDGANNLLDILAGYPETEIAGLASRNMKREAVAKASKMGIKIFSDYRELATLPKLDALIDATG
ncbi:MAG: Gfo/Idh/MocA family oxidoreductase, partial [Nitrospinae bacterium]|nr:Gfo/Idh/MocA family oxidoreductase [Nitrospinota bacterium]